MACQQITPAQFKAAKPAFNSISDAILLPYIELAQVWAGGNWPDRLCNSVQIAVTCHLLALDGLGDSPESHAFSSGEFEFQSVKSGNVTVTRFRGTAERAGHSTNDWFSQTACGRMFLVLMRMNYGGPLVVGGGRCGAVSPYAKDQFRDSWWP